MPYTFTISSLPGAMSITCTADTQKDVIREAHFWQSLPTRCPIDGTPTIFWFREPSDNQYYSVVSTGYPVFEYKIGQHRTGGTLFAKEEWAIYDGEKETVVWSRGKFTPAGEKYAQPKATVGPANQTPPPVQPPAEKTPPPPPVQPPAQNGQNGHPSGASKDFDAIPGKSAAGDVAKITDHQKKRIQEEAARIYGPDYEEAKLALWVSNNTTTKIASLNFDEAKTLLDALLRRASKQKESVPA